MVPLTVEEGIANGVAEVRTAAPYQIKHGAKLIKICASGGVMSLTEDQGVHHYSDEEFSAIVDATHRRGMRIAGHCLGADAVRHAVAAGIDCIEHGFLVDDDAIAQMVEHGTFLVATQRLTDATDLSKAPAELKDKAANIFPRARKSVLAADEARVKIAGGSAAPAIPHGRNADKLVALVDRGLPPLAVPRAATVTSAELINVSDRGGLPTASLPMSWAFPAIVWPTSAQPRRSSSS